jgi:hypothetical protein
VKVKITKNSPTKRTTLFIPGWIPIHNIGNPDQPVIHNSIAKSGVITLPHSLDTALSGWRFSSFSIYIYILIK